MEWRAFCLLVPGKAALGDHGAEFNKGLAIPDGILPYQECAGPVHHKEPVVGAEYLLVEIRPDPAPVRFGQGIHFHKEPAADHLEIGKGIVPGSAGNPLPKILFCYRSREIEGYPCDVRLFFRGWVLVQCGHYCDVSFIVVSSGLV
jgi:hypothetical protein